MAGIMIILWLKWHVNGCNKSFVYCVWDNTYIPSSSKCLHINFFLCHASGRVFPSSSSSMGKRSGGTIAFQQLIRSFSVISIKRRKRKIVKFYFPLNNAMYLFMHLKRVWNETNFFDFFHYCPQYMHINKLILIKFVQL